MNQRLERRVARDAARDMSMPVVLPKRGEPSPDFDRERDRADKRLAALTESRRLSQANRGLRMILVAAVFIVLISWVGTLGGQYLRLMQVETLVGADQDALRVMCAVEPPTERSLGWMHICETAAGAGPSGAVEAAAK